MCPDLRCCVYEMNGIEFDPHDATWVPRNTLGEYWLFIGDNYPIVKRMPPSVHGTEGRAIHEAWLCLQCAPLDERHDGTCYPSFMPLHVG